MLAPDKEGLAQFFFVPGPGNGLHGPALVNALGGRKSVENYLSEKTDVKSLVMAYFYYFFPKNCNFLGVLHVHINGSSNFQLGHIYPRQ